MSTFNCSMTLFLWSISTAWSSLILSTFWEFLRPISSTSAKCSCLVLAANSSYLWMCSLSCLISSRRLFWYCSLVRVSSLRDTAVWVIVTCKLSRPASDSRTKLWFSFTSRFRSLKTLSFSFKPINVFNLSSSSTSRSFKVIYSVNLSSWESYSWVNRFLTPFEGLVWGRALAGDFPAGISSLFVKDLGFYFW